MTKPEIYTPMYVESHHAWLKRWFPEKQEVYQQLTKRSLQIMLPYKVSLPRQSEKKTKGQSYMLS